MKTTKVHNTNSQYHGCWFPGNVKNQYINNNVIDLVYPEYSDLGSKKVNLKNAPLLLIENVVGEWCNSPSHKLGCYHQTVRIAHHIETTIVELCPCLWLIYQLFYPHAYWGVKCPANVRIMSTGFLLAQQIKAFNYSAHHNQSGRSPKVVALFSATNFSSYIIELLQLHDTIQIKCNYAWIHYNIAIGSHLMR